MSLCLYLATKRSLALYVTWRFSIFHIMDIFSPLAFFFLYIEEFSSKSQNYFLHISTRILCYILLKYIFPSISSKNLHTLTLLQQIYHYGFVSANEVFIFADLSIFSECPLQETWTYVAWLSKEQIISLSIHSWTSNWLLKSIRLVKSFPFVSEIMLKEKFWRRL